MQRLAGSRPPASLDLVAVEGPDDVQVWTFDLDRSLSSRTAFAESLSEQELERAAAFATELDRDRYVVGRGVVRAMLGSLTETPAADLVLDQEPDSDKPRLASPTGIVFNLSHCENTALIAVGRSPGIRALGVDVELIRPDAAVDALARRFFSPAEQRELADLPASQRLRAFHDLWCLKEAVLKGIGTGLDLPLPDFDVQLAAAGPAAVTGRGAAKNRVTGWLVNPLYIADRFSAALAVLR
jgi:4'-phosphopantetheinyl transferase